MNRKSIRWGILGAGDVCEVKSGPAFQKAEGSELLAVMRRDGDKAKDFAGRHGVPKWYDSVDKLLADPDLDAIYIATPPRYHLEHTLAALTAGKNVYLEKPMALTSEECRQIISAEKASRAKIAVAHYRRALPAFIKIGELLKSGAIGTPRMVEVSILQTPDNSAIASPEDSWRWNPAISGGGLFHDLAPHMLDLMLLYFGPPESVNGIALRQNSNAHAVDLVQGSMVFKGNIAFHGCWCFTVAACATRDSIIFTGNRGQISCNFFGETVQLSDETGSKVFNFTNPPHIQQPMIERVNEYFRGRSSCPCSPLDGLATVELMTRITADER